MTMSYPAICSGWFGVQVIVTALVTSTKLSNAKPS